MSRGIFITGTDTGVGKTRVAAGILRWLRQQGVDALPMKPVQTGGELVNGRLTSPDLDFCLAAAGIKPDEAEMPLMMPYIYGPACSPHLAGWLEHRYPDIAVIKGCADRLLQKHRAVLVEGAGGVLVPLNHKATMLDLMQALGYPVVLVSRFGLGTINHTMLSIQVLRAAGIKLVGVVFNHTAAPNAEDSFIEADNPAAIAEFGKVKVLGKIRYLDLKDKAVWEYFEADMTGLEAIREELAHG